MHVLVTVRVWSDGLELLVRGYLVQVPEQELIESMICAGLYGGTRSLQHIMARVLSRVLKIVNKEASTSFVSADALQFDGNTSI
jgi:hypothetical protein